MNKWLCGNGVWCAACEGTGRGSVSDIIEYEGGTECVFYHRCQSCNGEKRIAAPIADVIAARVPPSAPKHHTIMSQLLEYRRRPKRRAAA